MMRSLFSGVAGLKSHQTGMDILGSNISNVNTVGYKAGRVNFSDVISQTMQGASSSSNGRGGTNPIQVGTGVGITAVDTIMTAGSYQPTGKQTDLAIQNEGFFIVTDGKNQFYTRAGNFDFDASGNFVSASNGMKVMGWIGTNGVVDSSGGITPIKIPSGIMLPAEATTKMTYIGNLSGSDTPGASAQTSLDVYDSLGNVQNLSEKFTKVDGVNNVWLSKATLGDSNISVSNSMTEITFDSKGAVSKIRQVSFHEVPSKNLVLADSLQLNGTAAAVSTISGVSLYDSAGIAKKYDIAFTTTTANSDWSYTIKDSTTATVQTGTAHWDSVAKKYTFTTDAGGSLSTLNLSNSIGVAPGAAAADVHASIASTGLPQSNIKFASGLTLDSTATGSSHTLAFTLYDADGQVKNYKMKIDSTNGTAFTYNIYDASDTTFASSLGAGTITPATATSTNYFNPTTAFDPWGTGGITPISVGGIAPAAVFSGSIPKVTPGTTAVNIPALQLDNTSGSVHDAYYTVFDNNLNPHVLKMEFTQTSSNNWSYKLSEEGSASATELLSGTVKWDNSLATPAYVYTPAFDKNTFSIGTGAALTTITLGAPTTEVAPAGTSFIASSAATYGTGTTVNPVEFTPSGADKVSITMDLSALTQFGGSTTVQASNQNGSSAGSLYSVSINNSGMIVGKFSNGKNQDLAQVSLCVFTNAGGLVRVGDTLFSLSNNSGNPSIGTAGTGGRGALSSATLEMSNIDLADQFSKMIITQRGFQSNSKIITVSDEMLEILANLKR